MSHSTLTMYPYLIVSGAVANTLALNDIINGTGLPIDSVIQSITNIGGGQWKVTINQVPLAADVYATGNHNPYTDPSGASTNLVSWNIFLDVKGSEEPTAVLSFSEKVGGWVSLKSFTDMQMGISLANDYYTFYKGRLFLHHSEDQDRNTFYKSMGLPDDGFTASSINVVLNDNPGAVKVFNTLNYEGSQAFVNKFINPAVGLGTLQLPFQPQTTYSDQEYYNLYEKKGWSVKSIITNKEEGYAREFLEKEGKWFNGINKLVTVSSSPSDTGDFTFQGIGKVDAISIDGNGGGGGGGGGGQGIVCPDVLIKLKQNGLNFLIDPVGVGQTPGDYDSFTWNITGTGVFPQNFSYSGDSLAPPLALDLASVLAGGNQTYTLDVVFYWGSDSCANTVTFTTVLGCMEGGNPDYNSNANVEDGSCNTWGCTIPAATNYSSGATADDGSCVFNAASFDFQLRDQTAGNNNDGHARLAYAGTNTLADYPGLTFTWSNGATTPEQTTLSLGPIGVNISTFVGSTTYLNYSGFVLTNYVYGCTDPNATNFDYSTNTDDGSCII